MGRPDPTRAGREERAVSGYGYVLHRSGVIAAADRADPDYVKCVVAPDPSAWLTTRPWPSYTLYK